jgi:hypothetical protein
MKFKKYLQIKFKTDLVHNVLLGCFGESGHVGLCRIMK